jgi:hypothetical protein
MQTSSEALGVPFLDFTDEYSDDDFLDLIHLEPGAARDFSSLLAGRLIEIGW